MIHLTQHHLMDACGATSGNALKYAEHLTETCRRFDINTPQRVAAFLATVTVESGNLSAVEEGLWYSSADRLATIFKRVFKGNPQLAEPYVKNPKALSKVLYDGFHGRGLIQLTWKENYLKCGDALMVDFVKDPTLLTTPKYAALSAAWFWRTNGCNEAADRGDMDAVTKIVNGPAKLHLKERKAQYELAMTVPLYSTDGTLVA